jgi:NTP pyrophosphatase (non-canonical NTP hydrolase)
VFSPLTLDEHHMRLLRQNVAAMCNEAIQDGKRWFPDTGKNLFFMIACMGGEAGEVINIAKKIERGDTTWFDEHIQSQLREEIVDVFTYMLNIVHLLDMDLIEEYYKKRSFNEERFGKK